MNPLSDFPLLHSQDFKLSAPLTDEQFQDICTQIKTRVVKLVQKKPQVSIVFPAFNEEMYLPLMLWTLSKLATSTPIEIIGVNNSSTDRTGEIMQECWIIKIDEKRKWVSYARQAGLEAAQGEYIATTDADTQVPRDWIDVNLDYFRNDKNLVCFSSWSRMENIHPSHRYIQKIPQFIRAILWKSHPEGLQIFPGHNMFFKKENALSIWWYAPWFDLGEDNMLAQKLKSTWNIYTASNSSSQIVVSSRRLDSFVKLMTMYYQRVFSIQWLDYRDSISNEPQSFPDIR